MNEPLFTKEMLTPARLPEETKEQYVQRRGMVSQMMKIYRSGRMTYVWYSPKKEKPTDTNVGTFIKEKKIGPD